MKRSQPCLVIDTNILIDLHNGGLLSACCRLPFDFLAPDVIIAECHVPNAVDLVKAGLLEQAGFSSREVQEIGALTTQWRRVSVNDVFAFFLARREQAVLLTGDGALRRRAAAEGIEVHGILWLLDQMIALGIVPKTAAAQALRAMVAHGSRIPSTLYRRRLVLWEGH